MDGRFSKWMGAVLALASVAATHRTKNFVVTAPTPEIARQVAQAAEVYRRELAVDWLGAEMPNWSTPCKVQVTVGQIGAGGATSFTFNEGEVYNWIMSIQGSLDRILDSVLPHEISHTVFACHFRRPLPRWADEGAATLAENESEKLRQQRTVRQVLETGRRIPLRTLVAMQEYPTDMRDVLTLYAQGFSLAELLIEHGGKRRYLDFLEDAHSRGWDAALRTHYNVRDMESLERQWLAWVGSDGKPSQPAEQTALAQAPAQRKPAREPLVIRGQSPVAPLELSPQRTNIDLAQATTLRGADLHAPAPRRRPLPRQSAATTSKSQPASLQTDISLGEPDSIQTAALPPAGESQSQRNQGWVSVRRSSPPRPR